MSNYICPNCSRTIEQIGIHFCPHCGTNIDSLFQKEQEETRVGERIYAYHVSAGNGVHFYHSLDKSVEFLLPDNINDKLNPSNGCLFVELTEKQPKSDKRYKAKVLECINNFALLYGLSELPPSLEGARIFYDINSYCKEFSSINLNEYINKKYMEKKSARELGFSRDRKNKQNTFNFELDLRDKNDVPLAAFLQVYDGGTKKMRLYISQTQATQLFEKFVCVDDWAQLLTDLKELSLKGEKWDNKKNENYLKNYLCMSFYKLWMDGGLHEENGNMLFNTGLVDNAYDPIYCFLKKNSEENITAKKFVFEFFSCVGKGKTGKLLNDNFSQFPSAPQYIDTTNLPELYFDPKSHFHCDYEHIIMDNIERLPLEFVIENASVDQNAKAIVEKIGKIRTKDSAEVRSLYDYIRDESNPNILRYLQNRLKEAVETAVKYCEWNYKTAVPMYYPRANTISLLLPLKLVRTNQSPADVALVVQKLKNGNYQGQTILTMEMAYLNARQICRPNSDWLL